MHNLTLRSLLLACAGTGALLAVTADANAGGFALREQSSYGQGTSFAGVAAGGSLSTMFWNPATMTQQQGLQSESVYTAILPYAANTQTGGLPGGGTGNIGVNAIVPSGYASWQINPKLWLGLSVNAPYGLSVSFPAAWGGQAYANNDSHLRTYDVTPMMAYEINSWISVGFGVQLQYGDAGLSHAAVVGGGPVFANANLSGTGWGYGFTAGVTLKPTEGTTIGIGYRSALNQKINGNLVVAGVVNTPASTTINLPDVVSVGLKQRLNAQWTLLGTVEWTNWSRIGTSTVTNAVINPTILPFQYQDGWFYSLGAEYQWTDKLAVRGGVGYEKSPITDQVRIPLLPDNDRFWLSAGATYQWSQKLSLDFAYSHIFVKNAPINITAASGNPWFATTGVPYTGTVDAHVDIISIGIKYRWDDPAPIVKQRYAKAK